LDRTQAAKAAKPNGMTRFNPAYHPVSAPIAVPIHLPATACGEGFDDFWGKPSSGTASSLSVARSVFWRRNYCTPDHSALGRGLQSRVGYDVAMVSTSMVARLTAFLALLFLCVGAGEAPPPTDAGSLAEILRARLPEGWTITQQDERVILERAEPVELYNGLALPGVNQEAEIKLRARPHKLRISLWLGKHVTAQEFKQIREKNSAAIAQANRDTDAGRKNTPDAKFWEEHPEYGYRQTPILDAGKSSIYMESTLGCIAPPTAGARPTGNGRVMAFFDKSVEKECQGLIDGLGRLFAPFPVE
jgi:hypothetical protein